MTTRSLGLACIGLFVLCACSDGESFQQSQLKSGNNGVRCDVRYDALSDGNLNDIEIIDYGINENEKIRHLNELNSMPREFLNVMRRRVQISMTHGGITEAPPYASLKGQQVRGWPEGWTWDMVPGAGGRDSLVLGDSYMNNNAWSLAIHEAAHSVSFQTQILSSPELLAAFNAERRPHPQDPNGVYRTGYSEEYLAIAVDEYYCSAQQRANLRSWYPLAFEFMDKHFIRLLRQSGLAEEEFIPSDSSTSDSRLFP